MDFIQSQVGNLAKQLIQPRKYYYSSDHLDKFLQTYPQVTCKEFTIKNKRNETLSVIILKKCVSDTCLIYAHGLGSNKYEVVSLANYLYQTERDFIICAFDFSGSGKSQGQNTTYGILEQDDINTVLYYLDSLRISSKYILWGRSMGGASIILSQSSNLHKKVNCIVLDSPFSSFEKAAVQLASRSSKLPQIFVGWIIQLLKDYFNKNIPRTNPFSINIASEISSLKTRIMLIYSKQDSIIKYEHSKQISKYCRKNPIQLQIEEDHNKPRNKETYFKAFGFINDSIRMFESRAKSRSKSRGIQVASKENWDRQNRRSSTCRSQNSYKKTPNKKPKNIIFNEYQIRTEQIKHINNLPNRSIIKSVLYETDPDLKNHLQSIQTTSKKNKQCLRVSIKYPKSAFTTSTSLFN